MWVGWAQLIGGLVVLVIAGDFLVRSSVKLALFLRVSTLVIGLTIVSLGTSFPELVVSLNAALEGHPDISLGNVVGSNIANLALVLGISALLFPIAVRRTTVVFDWPLMLLATLLMIFFSWDRRIAHWEGAVLFAGLIAYNFFMIRASRIQRRKVDLDEDMAETDLHSRAELLRTLFIMVVSIAALIFGAEILVDGAVAVARSFGMEERIIALSIVAFGTSAPELATSIVALYKDESSISVGNLIGSNIFNILGILGVTAVVHPIDVNAQILHFDFLWALGIPILLYPVLLTRMKVTRLEGGLLFGCYLTYLWLII